MGGCRVIERLHSFPPEGHNQVTPADIRAVPQELAFPLQPDPARNPAFSHRRNASSGLGQGYISGALSILHKLSKMPQRFCLPIGLHLCHREKETVT
jgi:hypothetical protein